MEFDVLSRHKGYSRHLLCEASAGTGKTFTIEHLFVKCLLAPNMSIDKILVMTFTKAVARELRFRLKRALNLAIVSLDSQESLPDYLLQVVEEGRIQEAKERLTLARDDIDLAKIGTIHSFCYQMLAEVQKERYEWAETSHIKALIVAYFRRELNDTPLFVAELEHLFEANLNDMPTLLEKLQTLLWKQDDEPVRDVEEICSQLRQSKFLPIQIDHLVALASSFKGLNSKSGELKLEYRAIFENYVKLVNGGFQEDDIAAFIKDPFFCSELFAEPKAKVKADLDTSLLDQAKTIEPYLIELAHPDSIMKRLVRHVRQYVSRKLEEEMLLCQEELIEQMEKALQKPEFVQKIKSQFSSVIVDEFQDTDPKQWEIMQKLFFNDWEGSLIFVGDPKQAIYYFRKADVYSYIQAKNLPELDIVTLSKNFRSSSSLVSALNQLFADRMLFDLPRLQQIFAAPAITPAAKVADLQDATRGAIHFFIAEGSLGQKRNWPTQDLEEECFFPFIFQEIKNLMVQGIPLKEIAILVRDRYQGACITKYLNGRGIKATFTRQNSIVESEAHLFLKRLVRALMAPRDRSALVELISHPPYSYGTERLLLLQETTDEALAFWADEVSHLFKMRKRVEEQGIATLLQDVRFAAPAEFWRDFECLIDDAKDYKTLEAFQDYLLRLSMLSESEKEQRTVRFDPELDAVQVMTLHASKGLEFDVVLALGLASRTPSCLDASAKELEAEKMRLFYVGATRAKRRLYLPIARQLDQKEIAFSTASPMDLYLERVPLESLSSNITQSIITPKKVAPNAAMSSEKLFLPVKHEPLVITKQKLFLHSFTSLKEPQEKSRQELISDLPVGRGAGILFHKLFYELFSLQSCPPNLSVWLNSQLAGTMFEGYEASVEKILQETLTLPLNGFSLMDIDWKKSFCEEEFYVAEDHVTINRGSLDLLFEHDGKCYIVDWKSNILERYDEASLQMEVFERDYLLQARMYAKAAMSHFESFGGFFFIFVRAPAVYFVSPEECLYAK